MDIDHDKSNSIEMLFRMQKAFAQPWRQGIVSWLVFFFLFLLLSTPYLLLEASDQLVAVPRSTTNLRVSAPASATPPATVFLILMENHNWSQIKGSTSAPYINSLLNQAAHTEAYYNPPSIHPSEPNYLWLEAGTNFGITNDSPPSTNHQSSTAHLTTQLNSAGISWKAYEENISGTVCPLSDSGKYAVRHDPFVFFDDVTGVNNSASPYCIAHVRPYTELANDLTTGNIARYNFITPNVCDDMHDSSGCASDDSIKNGDNWLSTAVPTLLASSAYTNGGIIMITWDEGISGDGPIGMIVLSPNAKPGYSNTLHYTHSSTLRTLQEIFGVSPLLGDAVNATDLSDLFADTSSWGGTPTPAPTTTPISTATTGRTNTPTPTFTSTNLVTPTNTPVTLPALNPVADSYVDASNPTTNYGTQTTLRSDGSPIVNSYLRFNVQGVSGTVTSAILRIYATSSLTSGLGLRSVVDNTWGETAITYKNAPAFGSQTLLVSPQSFRSNTWLSLDVTALVSGNGLVSFALTSTNTTALSLSSREGTNKPQLIISVSSAATSTPTLTGTAPNTPAATYTPTATPTGTATVMSTSTPTATPTMTNTASFTSTPSSSASFNPVADSYVDASNRRTNYGTATTLLIDNSPTMNSYLRFDVQGMTGTVTSAILRIYARSSSTGGLNLRGVADNTWDETTITSKNAPTFGSQAFPVSPQSFNANTWVSVDVTALVSGNGLVSFALTSTNNTRVSFSSREGLQSPELIVQTATSESAASSLAASAPMQALLPTETPIPLASNTLAASPPPSPTSVSTDTATALPTLTGTGDGEVLVEADSNEVTRSAGWISKTQPAGASGGSYLINSAANDSLSLAFEGTQIAVIYIQGPSFGTFAVDVDGTIMQQVETTAPVYEFNDQFVVGGLAAGTHLLRILPVQGVVAIDALLMQSSVEAAPAATASARLSSSSTAEVTPATTPTALLFPTIAVNPATTEASSPLPTQSPPTSVPTFTLTPIIPTALPFPTLPPQPSPTPVPTSVPTSVPQELPAAANMDNDDRDWLHTSNWTLAAHDTGLAWSMNSSNTTMETLQWQQRIDLPSAATNIVLSFDSWLTADGKAMVVISTDGINWGAVAQVPTSVSWTPITVDLSAYKGHAIYLGFVWQNVAESPGGIWGIDNVLIAEQSPTQPTAVMPSPTDSSVATELVSPTDTEAEKTPPATVEVSPP